MGVLDRDDQATASPRADAEAAQLRAAQERVRGTARARAENAVLLAEPGGIAQADSLDRVATRLDRLSYYLAGQTPPAEQQASAAAADPGALIEAALARVAGAPARLHPALRDAIRAEPDPGRRGAKLLEAVVGSTDFLGVRFLPAGARAAQAVARVRIFDERNQEAGFGTGSMVSPRLLLTNHHVLQSAASAANSVIEFDFQVGLDGRELPVTTFALDPGAFFLTDAGLDFTLVAVEGAAGALAPFGFNPLIAAEGKAIVGDFVSIVQHPQAQLKQVALRENRVVKLEGDFMHYATDTEPGSSGSPVFNDQWEVVALHHASVPVGEDEEEGGIVNEGIRVSRIMRFARAQTLPAGVQVLLAEVRGATGGETAAGAVAAMPAATATATAAPGTTLQVRIPIDVTISVGGAEPVASVAVPATDDERIEIDPNYADRAGYRPGFLGAGRLRVPLPTLPDDLLERAARPAGATGRDAHVLKYHHFSVVLDTRRRLAFFTAVNIDGAAIDRPARESDKWSYDPRIPRAVQTGQSAYGTPLDRGHLVRRLDASWGADTAAAKLGRDDTFHWTNCTPQHERFNEGKNLWAGLEDYLLDAAEALDSKVVVFTGPVLDDATDDTFHGVQLPRQFWKVAVMVRRRDGRRSATGYLVSQAELLRAARLEEAVEIPKDFNYGAYRTFQVPVAQVERLTRLDFGTLAADDPLAGQEAVGAVVANAIEGTGDLTL